MPGFPVSQPSFLELKTPTPMFFYLNFGKSLEFYIEKINKTKIGNPGTVFALPYAMLQVHMVEDKLFMLVMFYCIPLRVKLFNFSEFIHVNHSYT